YILCRVHCAATPEIYTLALHDALPISARGASRGSGCWSSTPRSCGPTCTSPPVPGPARRTWNRRSRSSSTSPPTPRPPTSTSPRSEEHTSELQSRENLVCRLLLEKKKK